MVNSLQLAPSCSIVAEENPPNRLGGKKDDADCHQGVCGLSFFLFHSVAFLGSSVLQKS